MWAILTHSAGREQLSPRIKVGKLGFSILAELCFVPKLNIEKKLEKCLGTKIHFPEFSENSHGVQLWSPTQHRCCCTKLFKKQHHRNNVVWGVIHHVPGSRVRVNTEKLLWQWDFKAHEHCLKVCTYIHSIYINGISNLYIWRIFLYSKQK